MPGAFGTALPDATVGETLDKGEFRDRFRERTIVLTRLAAGHARDLAAEVNEAEGRGDASLRTKAELSALYERLLGEPGSRDPSGSLLVRVDAGPTAAGRLIDELVAASEDKDEFFASPMYAVRVVGWPPEHLKPDRPVEAPPGARLELFGTDPADDRRLPPPGPDGVLLRSSRFSLVNSGNRTATAPKRSWKINLDVEDGPDELLGMSRLNLKAMYNDPSQMRETLAWRMFDGAGIPASQHTYAKLAIDERYLGLFFFVEQVDRRFLKDHFGSNDRGNLYKAYCGDVGCATLERRSGPNGDDGGRQYFTTGGDPDERTYRLKTNEDDPARNTYDDLAELVRRIDGAGLPGGDGRFATDAFEDSMRDILNVDAFLRWAGVNLLVGGWDNYYATPSNYYLYNSGKKGAKDDVVGTPYFTWIPWDYDNSFGIDYHGTQWQYTDVIDWAGNTHEYWNRVGSPGKTSPIPLVQHLLANHDLCQYYLDHLEHLLEGPFTPEAILAQIAPDDASGLWARISTGAYLESDTPNGPPFTGRQFTNDAVYRTGCLQNELRTADAKIEGIVHYVRMRRDRAGQQLQALRATFPSGASGATFSGALEPLPAA